MDIDFLDPLDQQIAVSFTSFHDELLRHPGRQKTKTYYEICKKTYSRYYSRTISNWNNHKQCSKQNIVYDCSIPPQMHSLVYFFDFDLSFTASQCLEFLIFPWRTLFLIKIFYILVQLWQQKLICYFNHLSGKNHAATVLSDFHCSYYYDTNIIDEHSIRNQKIKQIKLWNILKSQQYHR